MPPLDFIRLSGANSRNLAMFRDISKSKWHGSPHPDWPDIAAIIRNQRKILQEFSDAEELFCAGTSTGAYAAILFGHYLRADLVHAFAAQTRIQPHSVGSNIDIPDAHYDLSKLLSSWNGKTRYKVYFSEDHVEDRKAAENLVNCPGVELIPLPGDSHNTFLKVDNAELLAHIFPKPDYSP